MSEYDHGYPTPRWFIDEVEKALSLDGGWTRARLIDRANELRGKRINPWEGSALTKFLNGDRQTIEFAIALATAIGMSPPFFMLEDKAEAEAVDRTLRRLRPVDESQKDAKRSAVAQSLESAVKVRTDQTRPVRSKDEGSPRRQGDRRAPRGRS